MQCQFYSIDNEGKDCYPTSRAYLHEISDFDESALRDDTVCMQRIAGHHHGLIVGGVFLSPDSVVGSAGAPHDCSTLFHRVLCTLYTAYTRECIRNKEHYIDAAQRVFEVYQKQDTIFAVVERLHDGNFVSYDYRFVGESDIDFLFVFVREERHSVLYAKFWDAARKGVPDEFYSSSSSVVAQWLKSTVLEAYPGSEFLLGEANVGNDEDVPTLPVISVDSEALGGASAVVGHELWQAPKELWETLCAVQGAATGFVRLRKTFRKDLTH